MESRISRWPRAPQRERSSQETRGSAQLNLLLVLDGELAFVCAHLPPKNLQVRRQRGVLRILAQRPRKPAVRGRQVATYAVPGVVHGAENCLSFRVAVHC